MNNNNFIKIFKGIMKKFLKIFQALQHQLVLLSKDKNN